MVLRGIFITSAVVIALIAMAGYSPLHEDVEDRYRAMLFNGLFTGFVVTPFAIGERIGFGSFLENVISVQTYGDFFLDILTPNSSSLGHLEVTRAELSGVPVIIYRPMDVSDGELLPGLVYLHGGGWALLNVDAYDRTVYDFANCSRKITISVDYRRAPQHPFPAPVQDCLDVTKYVLKNGKTLGIDVNRVGIAGDSAGGNMAAAVALRLTREKVPGLPALKYQALLFPTLQALDMRLPSFVQNGNVMPIPAWLHMTGFLALYLGLDPSKVDHYSRIFQQNRHVSPQLLRKSRFSEYIDVQNLPEKFRNPGQEMTPDPESYDVELFSQIEAKVTDPFFSPLMSPDLRGLPPTLVLVSEFDGLRDDGLLYAHRLRKAGVKTEVYIGRGYHCDFLRALPELFHSKTGRKSLNAVCAFIQNEM